MQVKSSKHIEWALHLSCYWKGTFLPGLLEFSNVWLWLLLNKKSIFIGKLRFIEAENQQYSSLLYRPDSFLVIFTRYAVSASHNSPWGRRGARYLHFYRWANETERLRTFSTVGDAQDSHSVADSLHQGSHRGGRCVMSGQVSGGVGLFSPCYFVCFTLNLKALKQGGRASS